MMLDKEQRDAFRYMYYEDKNIILSMTTDELRDVLDSFVPRPQLAPCGTRSAYARHLKNKEAPCDKCKQANNIHQREYYRTRLAKNDRYDEKDN